MKHDAAFNVAHIAQIKMNTFDYSLLETLNAVATERSFESAAAKLCITQSAVSQKIKLLESRIGAILVIRGRPCKLTPTGKRLCNHLNQVEILEEDLRKTLSMGTVVGSQPRTFRVAVNHDSLVTWFPRVILQTSRELNICFDIIPNDQDHTAEHLQNGEALAAVSSEQQPLNGFKRIRLGSLKYSAVATKTFMDEWFRDGVNLNTLSNAPSLIYNQMDTRLKNWCTHCFGSYPPLLSHAVPSFQGYEACCLNGVGWGILTTTSLAQHIQSSNLVKLLPNREIEVPIYWHYSSIQSETLTKLTKSVRNVAQDYLDPPTRGGE